MRFSGSDASAPLEDEHRLFYVAMTRSQNFLHLNWGPVRGNELFQKQSVPWKDILASKFVNRKATSYSGRKHLPPQPRAGVAKVVFLFSDLKYFLECPYQFTSSVSFYDFNAPIHETLGYCKSLHNALAEVHMRAIRSDVADAAEIPRLVETHLHLRYAYLALQAHLEAAAERMLRDYLSDNAVLFHKIEFSEKAIEIDLGDGVTVNGRIDLVRRRDTGEKTIVDLKSSDCAHTSDVTEAQLHAYALGYQELTGRHANFVEVYELDERKRRPRSVDDDFIVDVKPNVCDAAEALRNRTQVPALSAKSAMPAYIEAWTRQPVRRGPSDE